MDGVDGIMLSTPIFYPYFTYTGLLEFLCDAGLVTKVYIQSFGTCSYVDDIDLAFPIYLSAYQFELCTHVV